MTVVGLAMVTVVTTVFLKQYRPEISLLTAIIGSVVILIIIASDFRSNTDSFKELLNDFGVNSEIFAVILKGLGICLISDFVANTCRDFGLSALGAGVEFAGKTIIVVLSLPMIGEVAKRAVELIK